MAEVNILVPFPAPKKVQRISYNKDRKVHAHSEYCSGLIVVRAFWFLQYNTGNIRKYYYYYLVIE